MEKWHINHLNGVVFSAISNIQKASDVLETIRLTGTYEEPVDPYEEREEDEDPPEKPSITFIIEQRKRILRQYTVALALVRAEIIKRATK